MSPSERSLMELLAEDPSDVEARTELGLLYFSSGRLDDARAEFERALEAVPNDPVATYNLAAVLCAGGGAATALALIEPVLAQAPGIAILHYGKACALQLLKRRDEAIDSFQAALGLDENHASAWYGLGSVYQAKGDEASATRCFARACELDPAHPSAQHMLSSIAGGLAERPPAGFVRDLFDFYASTFDKHLIETLDYRAPALVLDALHPLIHARDDLSVIDLGCGTGLFGAQIRPHAKRLVGVDVSPAMLELARKKSIYDELIEADIVELLVTAPEASHDLIAAVDVFIYLGELGSVVAGAAKTLRDDGCLAFTVEADTGDGYSLSRNGRYRHTRAYLETLRADVGFEEHVFSPVTLRSEGKAPCEGFVVIWQKRRRRA